VHRGVRDGGAPAWVLVIEDNASDVFLLTLALKKQDLPFELVHLLNAGEATAFIRRLGCYRDAAIPDLILLDSNLSTYGGDGLLREIRSAAHLFGVPVCIWGSNLADCDEAPRRSLGVCQFITKPTGLDEFLEIGRTIANLLLRPKAA
jgi:DNA-binding response OmpR family regulator